MCEQIKHSDEILVIIDHVRPSNKLLYIVKIVKYQYCTSLEKSEKIDNVNIGLLHWSSRDNSVHTALLQAASVFPLFNVLAVIPSI